VAARIAAPVPEDPVASTDKSSVAIEHHGGTAGSGVSAGGVSAQVTAKLQAMERATQDHRSATQTPSSPRPDSDPSSVPVILLTLMGGWLIVGAAGFTVYRFRHHGPVGTATA
jgi:hypothetical protein